MKVAFVTFEAFPFIKVGGLADVAGSLPKYIKKRGVDIRVFLPFHKRIDGKDFERVGEVIVLPGEERAEIFENELYDVKFYFIKNDRYFGREGVYGTPEGDYVDNPERFSFFCRAVLESVKAIEFRPAIIHCNDMQTALVPAYLKFLYSRDNFFNGVKVIFTIHNLAYQGIYPKETMKLIYIPDGEFTYEKLEFYGKLNIMKAGIVYSDIITTVSPNYAKEIQTDDEHGMGLHMLLRYRSDDLLGILNGIDYTEWDPSKDENIFSNYSFQDMSGKFKCKQELVSLCGWVEDKLPIFGMVSRLDPIKGFDLLIDSFDELMRRNLKFIILGLGKEKYHNFFKKMEKVYPEKFKVFLKFDNVLAHKIYAGSDFFLMPSKFEPCGLGSMIALRYLTIPVVHSTGGLADIVSDFDFSSFKGNGFSFKHFDVENFLKVIDIALNAYYKLDIWNRLLHNANSYDFSWDRSVDNYFKVYCSLLDKLEKK